MSDMSKDNDIVVNMTRAERIKLLRRITGHSAEAFAKRYDIPLSTLKRWEAPSTTTLTEKGAMRLSLALAKNGIDCHPSWLLHGQGAGPTRIEMPPTLELPNLNDNTYNEQRLRAAHEFCQQYEDAVFLVIEDDAMEPYYYKNDIVAGIWLPRTEVATLKQPHCIMQYEGHRLLCRQLIYRETDEIDALVTNQTTQARPLIIERIKSGRVAPVLAVWKSIEIMASDSK